jgi:hypothetical protein
VNVVFGLGTDSVLHATGVFPPWGHPMADSLFGLALAYRVVYGVAGAYLTARLAPAAPMRYALILGVVGFVISLAGALATIGQGPAFGPLWYPLALVIVTLPVSWLGGWLLARRRAASQ